MKSALSVLLFLFLGTYVPAQTTYSNPSAIDIPDASFLPHTASPYPSTIQVSGQIGTILSVHVTLHNITHSLPANMDVLLVGPNGGTAVILSDVGAALDVTDVTIELDDTASTSLPASTQLQSGVFKPTNLGSGSDAWPSPAPFTSGQSSLSAFNGMDPNGTWSLYVVNDDDGSGTIAGGWSLTILSSFALSQTLPDFSASYEKEASTVLLKWTSTKEDRHPFIVESSTNGKDWQVLGQLASTGSGNYRFLDRNPVKGDNYYRLKQKKQNGLFELSKVITVLVSDTYLSFDFYPNPANSVVHLSCDGLMEKDIGIQLINMYGNVVINEMKGADNTRIDVGRVKPGIYLLKIVSGNQETVRRLIINH